MYHIIHRNYLHFRTLQTLQMEVKTENDDDVCGKRQGKPCNIAFLISFFMYSLLINAPTELVNAVLHINYHKCELTF